MHTSLYNAGPRWSEPGEGAAAWRGGGVSLGPVPPDRPATPVEGEAGGRGVGACTAPSQPLSTPGEGEAGRREGGVRSGGGVDSLCCWVSTLLLPPPPRLGGGCSEPRRCQGATPCYWRRGPHTMVVSSELMVVSSELNT